MRSDPLDDATAITLSSGTKRKVKGVLEGAGEALRDFAGDGSQERAGSARRRRPEG